MADNRLQAPPIDTPFIDENGVTRAWVAYLDNLGLDITTLLDEINTKLDQSEFTQVVLATAATDPAQVVVASGADSIDLADLNSQLAVLKTEINGVVDVVNDIRSKLIEGGFARENQ
jgi:hypothetical protein